MRVIATHEGPFLDIDPPCDEIDVAGICIARNKDGKLADFWVVEDTLGLMQQLGVVDAPGP